MKKFAFLFILTSFSAFSQTPRLCDLPADEMTSLISQFTTGCMRNNADLIRERESAFNNVSITDSNSSSANIVLYRDMEVCKCLEANEITGPIMRSSSPTVNPTLNRERERIPELRANISRISGELSLARNGMLFQASLFRPGGQSSDELVRSYNLRDGRFDANFQSELREANNLLRNSGTEDRFNADLDTSFLQTPQNFNSCATTRDLMNFAQVPSGGPGDFVFYENMQILARTNSQFNDGDWNYNSLVTHVREYLARKYRDPDSISEEENRSAALYFSRMKFLNNNPLYKNLFMSSATTPAIMNAKTALFEKLKTAYNLPDTACSAANMDNCREAFVSQARLERLTQESAAIFADEIVMGEVQSVGEGALQGLLDEAKRARERIANPFYFTPAGMETNCRDLTQNFAACVADYAQYCKSMDREIPRLRTDQSLMSPAFRRNAIIGDLNNVAMSSNSDVETSRNWLCERPRFNRTKTPASMEFSQYRESYCSTATPERRTLDCNPRNPNPLMFKFMTDYPGEMGNTDVTSIDDLHSPTRDYFEFIRGRVVRDGLQRQPIGSQVATGPAFDDGVDPAASIRQPTNLDRTNAINQVRSNTNNTAKSETERTGVVAEGSTGRTEVAKNVRPAPEPGTSRGGVQPGSYATYAPTLSPVMLARVPVPQGTPVEQLATYREQKVATETRIREIDTRRQVTEAQIPAASGSQLSELQAMIQSLQTLRQTQQENADELQARIASLEAAARNPQRSIAGSPDQSGSGDRSVVDAPGGPTPMFQSQAPLQSMGGGASTFPVGAGNVGGFGSASLGDVVSGAGAAGRRPVSSVIRYDQLRSSSDGSIIVGTDRRVGGSGSDSLDPRVMTEAESNPQLDLGTVSTEAYAGFESRDLNVLSLFADRIRGTQGDVVRISVASQIPGRPRIEMIVVKNNGRLLFQPLRTLAALNGAIDQSRR